MTGVPEHIQLAIERVEAFSDEEVQAAITARCAVINAEDPENWGFSKPPVFTMQESCPELVVELQDMSEEIRLIAGYPITPSLKVSRDSKGYLLYEQVVAGVAVETNNLRKWNARDLLIQGVANDLVKNGEVVVLSWDRVLIKSGKIIMIYPPFRSVW